MTTKDPQPWVYPDGYRTVSPDDGWSGMPIWSPRDEGDQERVSKETP